MCRQGAVNGGQGSDREGLQLTVLAAAAVNVYPCRPGVAGEENNGARLRVDAPEVECWSVQRLQSPKLGRKRVEEAATQGAITSAPLPESRCG